MFPNTKNTYDFSFADKIKEVFFNLFGVVPDQERFNANSVRKYRANRFALIRDEIQVPEEIVTAHFSQTAHDARTERNHYRNASEDAVFGLLDMYQADIENRLVNPKKNQRLEAIEETLVLNKTACSSIGEPTPLMEREQKLQEAEHKAKRACLMARIEKTTTPKRRRPSAPSPENSDFDSDLDSPNKSPVQKRRSVRFSTPIVTQDQEAGPSREPVEPVAEKEPSRRRKGGLTDREEFIKSMATFRNTKDSDGNYVIWTTEEKEACKLFNNVDPECASSIHNTVAIIEDSQFKHLSDESVSRIHGKVKAAAQRIWRNKYSSNQVSK